MGDTPIKVLQEKHGAEPPTDIYPMTSVEAVEGLETLLSTMEEQITTLDGQVVKKEGEQTVTGEKTFSSEIVSTSENFMRAKNSEYGVILRRDNTSLYILLTNKGNPDGSWNDLRPFRIDLATGDVHLGWTRTQTPSAEEYSDMVPSTSWVKDRIWVACGPSEYHYDGLTLNTNYLNDSEQTIMVVAKNKDKQNTVAWLGTDDNSTANMIVVARHWDGDLGDGSATLTFFVPPHRYYRVESDKSRWDDDFSRRTWTYFTRRTSA